MALQPRPGWTFSLGCSFCIRFYTLPGFGFGLVSQTESATNGAKWAESLGAAALLISTTVISNSVRAPFALALPRSISLFYARSRTLLLAPAPLLSPSFRRSRSLLCRSVALSLSVYRKATAHMKKGEFARASWAIFMSRNDGGGVAKMSVVVVYKPLPCW
eukprot:6179680-Pleurochrysis_carterae.AAC.2